MNLSILSTQDSNNQKKHSVSNKSKYDDKYREKRNYT